MRRLLYIFFAATLMVVAGCGEIPSPTKEKQMVLLYIAATETSVSGYAESNVIDLLQGHVPSKNSDSEALLVFLQDHDYASASTKSEATLKKYYTNRKGELLQELVANFGSDFDACQPESLAKVLSVAEAECKPTRRSLLFSSHGTGWLPKGYFDGPGEKSSSLSKERKTIGYDCKTKNEIDIRDFASTLARYHWDALLLDCCYMGTVEVAYQLKDCCDWIIASPTEILVQGFPYSCILDQLFLHPGQEGLEYICQKYYDMYKAQSGALQSGTIALVKCSEMENLATTCANIVSLRRPQMEAVRRLNVQHYFYRDSKDYFFDFGHYFEQFASEEQFSAFSAQLDKAVPFKKATPQFIGLAIDHYSGLSIYIPDSRYVSLNAYYGSLDWNKKVKILE